jgi:hypothetical protein
MEGSSSMYLFGTGDLTTDAQKRYRLFHVYLNARFGDSLNWYGFSPNPDGSILYNYEIEDMSPFSRVSYTYEGSYGFNRRERYVSLEVMRSIETFINTLEIK